MSKAAGISLLVLGLAVGLWLGFNPKAHQETLRDWNRATASVAHLKITNAVKPRASQASQPSAFKLPSISVSKVSTSAAWKQVSAAFETLWRSVESLWVRATASISNTR